MKKEDYAGLVGNEEIADAIVKFLTQTGMEPNFSKETGFVIGTNISRKVGNALCLIDVQQSRFVVNWVLFNKFDVKNRNLMAEMAWALSCINHALKFGAMWFNISTGEIGWRGIFDCHGSVPSENTMLQILAPVAIFDQDGKVIAEILSGKSVGLTTQGKAGATQSAGTAQSGCVVSLLAMALTATLILALVFAAI